MTAEDRELLATLRAELAALARDMAYVQAELSRQRGVFTRLAWLVVTGLVAAALRFAMEGGLNG